MEGQKYDLVIAGGGLAGLSLGLRLAAPEFAHLRIAILDKDKKDKNDRTWSFWTDNKNDRFAPIYRKTWSKLAFYAPGLERIEEPNPYHYASLRGIDFYKYALDLIDTAGHIEFVQTEVESIIEVDEYVEVLTSNGRIVGNFVFDSIVRKMPVDDHLFLWQHFLGWEIELTNGSFDDSMATFMDFRIDQVDGPTFVYVLPFTKTTALVEVTLFTKRLLEVDEYEEMLKEYLDQFLDEPYEVKEKELGKIPMTTAPFGQSSKRIIAIGTNNATVKASTGYAFTRIQRECDELVERIRRNKLSHVKGKKKFTWYDKTLLNVITTGKEDGRKVFTMMFEKNKIVNILKFLDDRTSVIEEIRIFRTLPFLSFLRGFLVENVFSLAKRKTVSNS